MNLRRHGRRGFSILEAMVAFAVLAIASTGALVGISASGRDIRDGQIRQYRTMLAEGKGQRMSLSDKQLLLVQSVPAPGTNPYLLGIGVAPWTRDTSVVVPGDLSTGAYFNIDATGQIEQVNVAGNPACGSPSIPAATYCRETLLVQDLPAPLGTHAAIVPAGIRTFTLWTRVSRRDEPQARAVVSREVIIQ